MTTPRVTVVGILALAVIAGCSNNIGTPDAGIAQQDPDLAAQGAVLYEANCAECHGSDLRGTDQGPSHLSEIYEPNHHADIAFLLAVQRGSQSHHWRFGDMDPIPSLDDDDVAAIVAFVRETQRREGFEPFPP